MIPQKLALRIRSTAIPYLKMLPLFQHFPGEPLTSAIDKNRTLVSTELDLSLGKTRKIRISSNICVSCPRCCYEMSTHRILLVVFAQIRSSCPTFIVQVAYTIALRNVKNRKIVVSGEVSNLSAVIMIVKVLESVGLHYLSKCVHHKTQNQSIDFNVHFTISIQFPIQMHLLSMPSINSCKMLSNRSNTFNSTSQCEKSLNYSSNDPWSFSSGRNNNDIGSVRWCIITVSFEIRPL